MAGSEGGERSVEVRGHEKKHQGKVVHERWVWRLQAVYQETTSRQLASRAFTRMRSSWYAKLP